MSQNVYIRNRDTGEIHETLNVDGWPQHQIERMIRGMSINLNHDEFYIDDQS